MTIREILSKATKLLQASANEDASQESRMLLAHVLKKKKEYLAMHPDLAVPSKDEQKYYSEIERRGKGEPIAYLVGSKEFYGLELFVNKNVLVPRPETECLVEEVLLVSKKLDLTETLFIDVGTGSGAIAIAVVKNILNAKVVAVDISRAALAVARGNAEQHRIKNISFLESDLLTDLPIPWEENVILMANLPYVPENEMEHLPATVRNYEPASALVAGADGLDLYRRLISQMLRQLPGKKVWLVFECDPAQINKMKRMIQFAFLHPQIKTYKDLSGKVRGGTAKIQL